MKLSASTREKIIARDAARARLGELQREQNELHETADEAAQKLAEANKKSAAQLYAEGKHLDVARLTETRREAQGRARVLGEAIVYQRTLVDAADAAAARAASEDAKAEHQAAVRNVVLGIVSALVSIEKARLIETELGELLSRGVLEVAGFNRIGSIDDGNAGWAWYTNSALTYGAITIPQLRSAFGDHWQRARAALDIDETPMLARAGRAIAATMGA